ncbi:MAG: hypothetical protein ACRDP1_14330 [Nocardioidaceae bacterium]
MAVANPAHDRACRVDSDTLGRNSDYALRWTAHRKGTFTFRVYIAGHRDHAPGFSDPVSVTVR